MFCYKYGHFKYCIIPFGLSNVLAAFQTYINLVLRKYLNIFILVYLNNIVMFLQQEESYIKHVWQDLQKLQEFNLYIKLFKCCFICNKIEFLGFIINHQGTFMDPARVKTI